jgi:hypothetical protein
MKKPMSKKEFEHSKKDKEMDRKEMKKINEKREKKGKK